MKSSPSLCIFANFYIDNDERFLRMRDSFFSFCDVQPDEWKINIRGRLKHHAAHFLRSELGAKADIYFLESPKGWSYDSYTYMANATSDYVLFWIEDHICLVDSEHLKALLMKCPYYR